MTDRNSNLPPGVTHADIEAQIMGREPPRGWKMTDTDELERRYQVVDEGFGSQAEWSLFNDMLTALRDRDAEIERLRSILIRIITTTPHSMCADAEAWALAEQYTGPPYAGQNSPPVKGGAEVPE